MKFINYISNLAIPFTVLAIISYGVLEKKKTFEIFIEGVKEGIRCFTHTYNAMKGILTII